MAKMRETFYEIQALAEDTAKDRSVADAAQRKTNIQEIATQAYKLAIAPPDTTTGGLPDIPITDDGVPPEKASNLEAVPLIGGLAIQWQRPPNEDLVRYAQIRWRPEGGNQQTIQSDSNQGHTLLGLQGGVTHFISVNLIDVFGRASGYSEEIEAAPVTSAVDHINFTELEALGRLQGLLPNANLATIEDATKLGTGVVLAEAMAVQDAIAFSLWATEAMIDTAYIASLTVDKLIGGEIRTNDIFIGSNMHLAAGGMFTAGEGTTIDVGGVTLAPGPNFNTRVYNTDQKISAEGDWASLAFFNDASPDFRGAVVRSDGGGNRKGAVLLHATINGNFDATTSAKLEVIANDDGGEGRVYVEHNLVVERRITCNNVVMNTGQAIGRNQFHLETVDGVQRVMVWDG